MKLIFTHTCQVILYGNNQSEQCEKQTQIRCSICRRWCCALHREDLKVGTHKMVLCLNCIPEEREDEA